MTAVRRYNRFYSTSSRGARRLFKRAAWLLPLAYALCLPPHVKAQASGGQLSPVSPLLVSSPTLTPSGALAGPAVDLSTTHPAYEIIPGNGGTTGYVLSHPGVVPDTLSVYQEGRRLVEGKDYWLNAAGGSLVLAAPVLQGSSISASYRYSTAPGAATSAAPPALHFSLGGGGQLGLVFGSDMAVGPGLSGTLNGLSLSSKFGGGGLYQGLAYFSNVQRSRNLDLNLHPVLDGAPAAPTTPTGQDHLLLQSLGLQSRSLQLNVEYQDVGEKFQGFSQLMAASAGDAAATAQLKQLQAEQGTKRLGFGMDLGASPASGASPLALNWNQISDSKGSINLANAAFHVGSLSLNFANSQIGTGFNHFAGLRDTDRQALALDIYHAYDPAATAAALTAPDLAQAPQESGIDRMVESAALDGRKTGLAVSSMRVTDSSASGSHPAKSAAPRPGFTRTSAAMKLGSLQLHYLSRSTDAGFTRMAGLSDLDKKFLALDLLREFDPNAQLSQVTPVEMTQAAADEQGISRSLLAGSLSLGRAKSPISLDFSQLRVGQAGAAATGRSAQSGAGLRRDQFGFASPSLHVQLLNQTVSPYFTRLASLSDVERAQFGLETGLSRSETHVLWNIHQHLSLGYDSLSIGGTAEAAAAAQRSAANHPSDAARAVASALAGYRRQTFTIQDKSLSLAANVSDTSSDFTRAADLGLPAPEKAAIAQERGFHTADITLHFTGVRGMTLDSYNLRATDPIDRLMHDVVKSALVYSPRKGLQLSLSATGDVAGAAGAQNGSRQTAGVLDAPFGRKGALKLSQQSSATIANGKTQEAIQQAALHLDAPQAAATSLDVSTNTMSLATGAFEDTSTFAVHAAPVHQLLMGYTSTQVSQSPDAHNVPQNGQSKVSEDTNAVDVQYAATPKFTVVFDQAQRQTNDNSNGDTVSVGLKGQPSANLTLDATFDEQHDMTSKDTRDVANFAIGNAKPFNMGAVRNVTLRAGYVSLNDQRKLQNDTMTGHVEWQLWKNSFLVDYNGARLPDGRETITRTYQFNTDPAPSRWFHGAFLYKDRTLLDGARALVRRFTADARLSKTMQFQYMYGTMPEDAQGNLTPLTSANVALKQQFKKGIDSSFFYQLSDNRQTRILTRSLGLSIGGPLSSRSRLELALSKDVDGFATRYDRMDQLQLSFDQKFTDTDFVSLSLAIRTHDGKDAAGLPLSDEIRGSLDLNFIF